jgi:hypothetical protein
MIGLLTDLEKADVAGKIAAADTAVFKNDLRD